MLSGTKPRKFSEVLKERLFSDEELIQTIYEILEEKDPQEVYETYLLFNTIIASEEDKRIVKVIPTIEAFVFENYPLFEMWEYLNPSGKEKNLNLWSSWMPYLIEARIRFAMVELGKNPDYIRDKIEFLLEIGRKVRQTGVMEFYFHAINNKTEEWNAKTFGVAERLKEKRDTAEKVEDMFADFTFKGKKFGKIFYSAYSPIIIPQQESEVENFGQEFFDRYLRYHIDPYLSQEKYELFYAYPIENFWFKAMGIFVVKKGFVKISS